MKKVQQLTASFLLALLLLASTTAFAIDSDGDDVDDNIDAFPNDACASVNTDGDGKPDVITRNNNCFAEDFENGISNYPWQGIQVQSSSSWSITSAGQEGLAALEGSSHNSLRVTHTFPVNTTLTFYFRNPSRMCFSAQLAKGTFTGGVNSITLDGNVSTWTKKSVQINAGARTLTWQGAYIACGIDWTETY